MEPILSDPLIEDPAQIAFDGNGRMFVVELRGYFETPEGVDLIPPIGRISMHEDRDNDGVYEHHTVFVDKLVFPAVRDAVRRQHHPDDGDQCRTKCGNTPIRTATAWPTRRSCSRRTSAEPGNMESQQSSLFWAMDNWLYSTVNAFRLRWTPNGLLREPTGPNGAQWGATQDNDGKVWFQGGASGMPGYFQFPVHYGNFASPDQFEPDLNIVWGAPILIGDIQAGLPGTRMPDGSLIYGTAAAGQRDLSRRPAAEGLRRRLPLRRRRRPHRAPTRPVKTEGLTQLQNVYPRSEFIRSLDPLFRPVDIATGSRRHDLHRRHVPRHHRGRRVGEGGHLPPGKRSSNTSWTKSMRSRPHLATDLRRHGA